LQRAWLLVQALFRFPIPVFPFGDLSLKHVKKVSDFLKLLLETVPCPARRFGRHAVQAVLNGLSDLWNIAHA
jgi:hypothetical protein